MLTQCVPRFNKIAKFSIPFTRFWFASIGIKIALGKIIPNSPFDTKEKSDLVDVKRWLTTHRQSNLRNPSLPIGSLLLCSYAEDRLQRVLPLRVNLPHFKQNSTLMKNIPKIFLYSLAILLGAIASVQADVSIVQTQEFSFETNFDTLPPGLTIVTDDDFFTASFNPFDLSTGSLKSITLGLSGFTAGVGGLAGSLAGAVSLNDQILFGFGQGGGGVNDGSTITLDLTSTPNFQDTFVVFDDFTGADLAVFQAATGAGPVVINFGGAFDLSGNVSDVSASTSGTISLSFDLVHVPEPSSAVVLCFFAGAMLGRRRR